MKEEIRTRIFYGDKELLPDENGKITLPDELQKRMLEFFLKTSIPRMKKQKEQALKAEQERLASETNSE